MRIRLVLSFALIVLISVVGVVMIARQETLTEVRAFMFPGGVSQANDAAVLLEQYYQANHSWLGVDVLLRSRNMGPGMGFGPNGGRGILRTMMNQRLRLADPTGKVLADTSTAEPSGKLTQDEMGRAIPLTYLSQTVGYLLPEQGVSFTATDEQLLLGRLNRAALVAGLVAGGLSLLLALYLAYRLIRPVQELTQAAEKLAGGDLSQRVAVLGKDEMATLADTFNQMADSLQQAQESRRAMTADIAHELRTPLAVQLANLEALQDGIYPLTPENLNPLLEQNRLLTHLVEDLRILAMADAGQLKLEPVETDLKALVNGTIDHFRPQAAANQVELSLAVDQAIPMIQVDPARVEQILNNLLSNALRYTLAGGKISIGLSQTASEVLLTVHDSGTGIPEEALPSIFERFFRADKSRSRAEGGSGLGLAIARNLAQAHSGSLTASNHPAGGAVFTLTLPIKPPEKA